MLWMSFRDVFRAPFYRKTLFEHFKHISIILVLYNNKSQFFSFTFCVRLRELHKVGCVCRGVDVLRVDVDLKNTFSGAFWKIVSDPCVLKQ